MNNSGKVVVTVTPAGNVKIDAIGFKGNACDKATEQLHVVLGGGAAQTSKKRKPDFFATNTGGVKATLGR